MDNKEAIEILKPLFEQCKGTNGCVGYIEHYFTKHEEMALDLAINALERSQGKWIKHCTDNLLWGHNECPFCHKRSNADANYCQYCGARMERTDDVHN